MKKLLMAGFMLAASMFGQATQQQQEVRACFPEGPPFVITMSNDIYWNAQPPAVRKLRSLPPLDPTRSQQAVDLAAQGYKIDANIVLDGGSPVCVMSLRKLWGYTWVTSLLSPQIVVGPGIDFPGAPKYDPANPPSYAIPVSVDASAYPAFDPPAPPPVVVYQGVVGACYPAVGRTVCSAGANKAVLDTLKNGDPVTENGKKYKANVSVSPFGRVVFFELVN